VLITRKNSSVHFYESKMNDFELLKTDGQTYNKGVVEMDTIFKDKEGKPIYVLGLQSHNSSNGNWEMIDKSIKAVKLYHGNTLEVPVYWYQIEPEEGCFDLSMVETLIKKVRESGLHLIILWFGFSKNAELTYMPEWAKKDTDRFRLAVGPDGSFVAAISPHCDSIYEADKKAFVELIKCIKRVDESEKTVIAVQVENEIGIYKVDRCYSKEAQEDFNKGVPAELDGITLEDSGANGEGNSWYDHFGRHAHEAFTAWYYGIGIEKIASAGKAIYPDLPLYMNTMLGELRQEIAGHSYSSGSPVGRVLDIWKKAAPSISLIAPDIYLPYKSGYLRACSVYARDDNPLFIPETGTGGDGFALNIIHAAVDYGALGICCFGAEHTFGSGECLTEESQKVATSMQIIKSMAPILLKHGKSDKVFCVTQEEFQDIKYVKREKFHVTFHFTNIGEKGYVLGRSLRISSLVADNPNIFNQRGRGIIYEASPYEFYISGVGFTAKFLYRTDPNDTCPYKTYMSRAYTEVSALTIEEGHFTPEGEWVCEFVRNGDEMGAFVYPGIVLRVKLNPNIYKPVFD
jgi:beta-galactosidase GanA